MQVVGVRQIYKSPINKHIIFCKWCEFVDEQMEFGVISIFELPGFPYLQQRSIRLYIIQHKDVPFYTIRVTYCGVSGKGRPKVANYAAYVINYGALVANYGTFVVNDGALVVNDGALVVNDGTLVVNDGALVVNDGVLVANDGALVRNFLWKVFKVEVKLQNIGVKVANIGAKVANLRLIVSDYFHNLI
ncbi:hypothetical protein A3860_20885 [Niastella vici]|uniref:Uncharacterized protein n=2 Tax=Niastella vici TaxID=1703345 RepID=A0A1V9G1J8_9BACT|nr:hypothetical protein A3860_20885 [Niastella vici]